MGNKLLLALVFLLPLSAWANEPVLTREELLLRGLLPVGELSAKTLDTFPAAHSLPWPVEFQDAAHQIGNAMAQYQPFGRLPYFHGGCDLRVNAGASVIAPVAGRLEAGHYGYSTRNDGSMEKFWSAWPSEGDPTYFEVAVVADSGIRYEFHHVNRDSLPTPIVNMLNAGGGRVEAGTLLGHAITWPDGEYHHIHYNLIAPDGMRINPEYVSPLVPDHLAPEIAGAFAVMPSGSVDFATGDFSQRPSSFVIALLDRQDESVYEHPVSLARLRFASGEETSWDFRQSLMAGGKFPPLWEYFVRSFRAPSGQTFWTEGGYGTGQSVIQLKVPQGASGAFIIDLEDIAGNRTELKGKMP